MTDSAITQAFVGFQSPESNFTSMPLDLIFALPIFDTLAELKIVLYILRHTWGYREYEEGKRITLDEFEHGRRKRDGNRLDSGVGMVRNSVLSGIEKAVGHGFISVEVNDTDKARIEKFYSLRMFKDCTPNDNQGFKDCTPEVQSLNTSGSTFEHRSEINTIDKDSKINTDSAKRESESVEASKPPEIPLTPSSALPPSPAPVAPEGYGWLCSAVSDSQMHLIPLGKPYVSAKPLCKASVIHRVKWSPQLHKPACQECLRLASNPSLASAETWTPAVKDAFAKLVRMDWTIVDNAKLMSKALRSLDGKITIDGLRRFYANWYKCDWRGRDGQAPDPQQVVKHWIAYTESDECKEGSTNGQTSRTAEAVHARPGAVQPGGDAGREGQPSANQTRERPKERDVKVISVAEAKLRGLLR